MAVDSSRSPGDSWDLASSVGATATMVAAARALASTAADPIIDDPFAAPLVRERSASTYATTGRMPCATMDSTTRNRQPGARRAC
ncbi:hypothetical protein MGAST_27100 [Mycobacterium gastri 'Wayne']|nr:hypothetical protein MGAST_27100 [Mycobacterium gastri 'Wayne']